MDYFKDEEARDGLRWSWHYYPNKKVKDKGPAQDIFYPEMVVPLGCHYTPVKYLPNLPKLPYGPSKCKSCGAVANCYCRVDFSSRYWACPFCRSRNDFSQQHAQMTDQTLAVEFHQGCTTVEYTLPTSNVGPPVLIYLIDTATTEQELEALKDQINQSLSRLPDDCLLGLITFGKMVSVWEVGYSECSKCVMLSGTSPIDVNKAKDYLGLHQGSPEGGVEGRFLVSLSDAELAFQTVLEELNVDNFPVPVSKRPERAAGAAIETAVALGEALVGSTNRRHHGRLLLFLTGPCTRGPGQIVSLDEAETIRFHRDIQDGQAPFLASATDFGKRVGQRLRNIGWSLDTFACALDQVGILEISDAIVYTGGRIITPDSFLSDEFTGSFKKFFDKAKVNEGEEPTCNMFFNATLEVQTSKDTKIAGLIGPFRSLEKMSPSVSTTIEVGESKTCAWSTSVIDQSTTVAVVFDAAEDEGAATDGQNRFTQFITSYLTFEGQRKLRVTTTCHRIAPSSSPSDINSVLAFDQLAAAALVAKMAAMHMDRNANRHTTTTKWIDRLTIRFVRKFADFRPNDPNSLRLAQQYTLFPQFMFHLRRSEFLQVFNSSPDDTVFFRSCLIRESVASAEVMIQPLLLSYAYGSEEPEVVKLDSKSVKADNILLCDAFFDVTIHHGQTITHLRNQNYHNLPEYFQFKRQLEAPHHEMANLIENRFPVPKIIICDQYGSQARYILARINPSDTKAENATGDAQVIFTDDANLQTFMQRLRQLVVDTEKH
eukprot:Sspe_Gene.49415::Locus_26628_Transcript_1_2_Confidence_0.500_Length_2602::g.49415::m.49415/K14006/SEC23; protein transport protein SEC23